LISEKKGPEGRVKKISGRGIAEGGLSLVENEMNESF